MNVAISNRLKRLLKIRENAKTKALKETIDAEIIWTQNLLDEVTKKNSKLLIR